MIYEAIASLPGTHAYSDYLMVVCPFHGGEKPNMMVSQRTGKAYCMGEGRFYELEETYSRLLVMPPTTEAPGPAYPDRVVPIRPGTWVAQELHHRRITDYSRLAMGPDGNSLAFLDKRNRVQVYRFGDGFGYRTVGKDLIWSQQDIGNTFLGTLVVYGMLDAVACVPVVSPLNMLVVTGTRGQTSYAAPYLSLPAPIWVCPDRYEERNALRLLSRLGWRAGGMIDPLPEYKDPSDVISVMGHAWTTTYVSSYVLMDWSRRGETEAVHPTEHEAVLAAGQ